jgi:hypothetical protein
MGAGRVAWRRGFSASSGSGGPIRVVGIAFVECGSAYTLLARMGPGELRRLRPVLDRAMLSLRDVR